VRRFIASLPGRIISHAALAALIMPAFTLIALNSKAEAQFAALDQIAVDQFVVTAPQGGADLGKQMADAVGNELSKTNQYDVKSQDTVGRVADSIGLQMPVVGMTNLLRLGAELQVKYLAVGEILNYRIVKEGSLKHADIIVKTRVIDVSSGLDVKGAATIGHSTSRAGSVTDATLIGEAITAAASVLVRQLMDQKLTKGTLLNTVGDSALVNQGARAGFEEGQRVIVRRGREQVATASIYDVEPDQSYAKILTSKRGLQPGDTVEVLYGVPNISSKWPKDPNTEVPTAGPRTTRPSNDGFVKILLLAGLLGILFGSNHGSNTNVFTGVQAQAGLFIGNQPSSDPSSGTPGVEVSWGTDFSLRGNTQRYQFQVYRENPTETIAISVPGSQSFAVDNAAGQSATFSNFGNVVGGTTCANPAPPGVTTATVVPQVIGQPYQYGVELVYVLSSLDLPNPGGTVQSCYFVTPRAFTQGVATPLNQPQQTFPSDPFPITGPITFSFNSSQTGTVLITVDYCVEVSASSTFNPGQTVVVSKFTSNTSGTLSTPSQVDLSSVSLPLAIRQAQTLFWRVGARNNADRPGPLPDLIGEHYIFSAWLRLTRPAVPPGGP